ETRRRAESQMRSLLACFDAFAGENHLRVAGVNIAGITFAGSDLPWRRGRFDEKLSSGRFAPRRRGVVSAREIAGLLKPPSVHCAAENVARSGGVIPAAPIGLPRFSGQRDLIPLGRVKDRAGQRLVGVRASETYFSYMAGRSRYGKTETAIGQFVHLVRSGNGGMFLDPHADAIREIRTYLADMPERVIEIDLSDPDGRDAQPAWNLFWLQQRNATQAAARVEAFVDALAAALRWDDRNTRALNIATQSAQALSELARRLPAKLAPTIFQVPTLLSNSEWREAALPHLSHGTASFFRDRYPRLAPDAATAVTNIIDRLRAARTVSALMGRPVSTYSAERAMRDGMIVLACPGSGSTRDRLVANLLVYDLLHAFRQRAHIDPGRRRPFWLFLDELQTYDGPNLPVLLEQSAKYGGRAFLFNQNPDRLSEATWNAVTTNRSHLSSTTVNAHASQMIAREWSGQIQPDVLTRLERFTYVSQVTLGRKASKPFLVRGVTARELHVQHHTPLPVKPPPVAGTTGAIEQALKLVEGHDERILRWLQQHPPSRGAREHAGEAARGGGRRVLQPATSPEAVPR
ncbi:MAG: type IV secretory system conjugative DNA transfer family protein, partial [Solirubrobacteraceae bacterium]